MFNKLRITELVPQIVMLIALSSLIVLSIVVISCSNAEESYQVTSEDEFQEPQDGGQTGLQARDESQTELETQDKGHAEIQPEDLGITKPFSGSILLGRPTDKSITINLVSDTDVEVYFEYGAEPLDHTEQTGVTYCLGGDSVELVLDHLQPDTRYLYRIRYRQADETTFSQGEEHSFHTQRQPGSKFTFTVQSDSHLGDSNYSAELYERTLLNALDDNPDFHIDLGDTFMAEKLAANYDEAVALYLEQRSYFGLICHSAPLFLVNGNHEGELGWELDGTPNNIAIWATNARLLYYPNPEPNDFYSGSTTIDDYVGLRENYYTWEWGDALFIVLDPFWYTTTKPGRSGDNWDWTLGYQQYSWLEQTLEESDAKFKFVLCHHLVGGGPSTQNGRGGIEAAEYYEWGGLNEDGTWGFTDSRPNWDKPIHQLMVDNNVTIFFHGHDHFFAKQELDGVVYQLIPQPSFTNYDNTRNAEKFGYLSGDFLGNSGHLRITVSALEVTVDYIRAYLAEDESLDQTNGEVAYTYTINTNE